MFRKRLPGAAHLMRQQQMAKEEGQHNRPSNSEVRRRRRQAAIEQYALEAHDREVAEAAKQLQEATAQPYIDSILELLERAGYPNVQVLDIPRGWGVFRYKRHVAAWLLYTRTSKTAFITPPVMGDDTGQDYVSVRVDTMQAYLLEDGTIREEHSSHTEMGGTFRHYTTLGDRGTTYRYPRYLDYHQATFDLYDLLGHFEQRLRHQ